MSDMPKSGSMHGPGAARPRRAFAAAFLACALLSAPGLSARAARIYPSAGSTSAAFLKIGVGARAVAMGGAYTAIDGDPYAVYWNPAGLASIEDKTLVFTHNEYFAGLSQEYTAYGAPGSALKFLPSRLRNGGLGLSLNYFYTGKDLERRSGAFEADPLNPLSAPEGRFRAYDLALSFGYGLNLGQDLKAGAALKLIRQSIDTESGASAALDLGALKDFDWLGRNFTAGFAVQNLGPGIKFVEKRYPLPLTFKAGLSHRLYAKSLLLALDVSKPVDNYPSAALGVEQQLGKLQLRGGYRYRQYGNEAGGWSGFSVGLGFVYGRFSFDYAMSPFGDLGNTHRLSAALRFPSPKAPVLKERGAVVPASQALSDVRPLRLNFEQKPLIVSARGVSYLVKASAAAPAGAPPAIVSLSYITLMRGEGKADLSLAEGALPGVLLEKFPAPAGPLKAWQLLSVSGSLSGNIRVEFTLAKEPPAGEPELYYLAEGGWKSAAAAAGECGGATCLYSASVPFSTHYALAVK